MKKIITLTLISLIPYFAAGQSSAQLITEPSSIENNEPFWVAVKISLDEGWHTYWQNPGETGFPTSIEWDLPDGFTASEIHWPAPQRFKFMDLINYGYENEAYLLVQIYPPAKIPQNTELNLKGKAKWLACKDMCIPEEIAFKKKILANSPQPIILNPLFNKLRAELPQNLSTLWKLSSHIHNEELGILIQPLASDLPTPSSETYFYPESETIEPSWNQQLVKLTTGYFLKIPLEADETQPEQIEGIITNPNGWDKDGLIKSILISSEVTPMPVIQQVTHEKEVTSVPLAIAFAFIGGLILNLMPCVFPVLSLKIIGFVEYGGKDPLKTKLHGLTFGAGVLASFWALSGALLALRAGGELLGWGFQLQSPGFIVFLILLLVVIALNFAGVFEVGTSFISTGARFGQGSGLVGSFSSGILATVLATPCTAPFMGTALGFALTLHPIQSLMIFTSLAVGMASPYVILSFAPKLLKFLPKPGAWMETFKQIMAFPMLATVIWLLWVLAIQTGNSGLILVLFAALFISLSAWTYGRFCNFSASKTSKFFGKLLAILFLISGTVVAYYSATSTSSSNHSCEIDTQWETFSEELVSKYRNEGRPVYIDFTAAWCLTCQANKAAVFTSQEVMNALNKDNFALLRADWTSQDPKITKALAKLGRSGVPTNVIYSANLEQAPIILPSLLTPSIVIEAIKSL